MAAMSESKVLCNSNIVPSHVSSNGYYGYVPLIGQFTKNHCEYTHQHDNNHGSGVYLQENQQASIQTNGHHNERQVLQTENYCCENTLAMETDDDEHYRNGMLGICCQNNHCVIPEIENGGKDVELLINNRGTKRNGERIEYYPHHYVNRKRNNTDTEIYYGQPAGPMKKFKQGGGNGLVNHGPGITREPRSSKMHNDSPSLCIASMKIRPNWYNNFHNNCCTKAAGKCYNCHSINNETVDYNELSCNRCTSVHHTEYEKLLMETHGCTIYHHQRQQEIDNGTIETEF